MEIIIKTENIEELDEVILTLKEKNGIDQEELLMFLKGVSLGQILARKKYNQGKETA